MASISFRGEAAESFANLLQHIEGYTVEVVPALEACVEFPTPFDAVVIGSAADEEDDYFAVRVQRWNDETGEGDGEPFNVVVSELKVY